MRKILFFTFCGWTLAQYVPFQYQGRWGLLKNKDTLISPQFEMLHYLSHPYYLFQQQRRLGILRVEPFQIITPALYKRIHPTFMHFFAVEDEEGWHFVTKQGKRIAVGADSVVPIYYRQLWMFFKKKQQFFLSPKGEIYTPTSLDATVSIVASSQGYKVALPLLNEKIFKSVAVVQRLLLLSEDADLYRDTLLRYVPSYGTWQVVDLEGKPLLPIAVRYWRIVKEGLIALYARGKWALADSRQGRLLCSFIYDSIGVFSNGYAPYNVGGQRIQGRFRGGQWGLIDTLGNRIQLPRYKNIAYLNYQWWKIQRGQKWSILHPLYGEPFPAIFDQVFAWSRFIMVQLKQPYTYLQKEQLKEWRISTQTSFVYVLLDSALNLVKTFPNQWIEQLSDTFIAVPHQGKFLLIKGPQLFHYRLNHKPIAIYATLAVTKGPQRFYIEDLRKETIIDSCDFWELQQNNFLLCYDEQGMRLYDINTGLQRYQSTHRGEQYIFKEATGKWILMEKNDGYAICDLDLRPQTAYTLDSVIALEFPYYLVLERSCWYIWNLKVRSKKKVICRVGKVKYLGEGYIAFWLGHRWQLYFYPEHRWENHWNILAIHEFSEGRAVIRTSQGWNWLTNQGQLLTSQFYERTYSFYNGFAYFQQQQRYGIIDVNGKIVLSPSLWGINIHDAHYKGIFHVQIEKTLLRRKNTKGYRWVFIDTSGKEAVRTVYEPSGGLTPVGYPFIKAGYIDPEGRVYSRQWGWALKNGKVLLPPRYDSIFYWQKAYLWAHKGEVQLYEIEGKRAKAIKGMRFEAIKPLSKDFYAVKRKGQWYLLFVDSLSQYFSIPWETIKAVTSNYVVGKRLGHQALMLLTIPTPITLPSLLRFYPLDAHYMAVRSSVLFRRYIVLE